MQKTEQSSLEEDRVRAFLEPLKEIEPVARPTRHIAPRRRPRLTVAIAAVLLFSGVAVAADRVFGPLHDATIEPIPNKVNCLGIVGLSGDEAAARLRERGYEVSWRFTRWGDRAHPGQAPREPDAITGGFTRSPSKPPKGSVVYDALQTAGPASVIVFLQARGDPNAPRIKEPAC